MRCNRAIVAAISSSAVSGSAFSSFSSAAAATRCSSLAPHEPVSGGIDDNSVGIYIGWCVEVKSVRLLSACIQTSILCDSSLYVINKSHKLDINILDKRM